MSCQTDKLYTFFNHNYLIDFVSYFTRTCRIRFWCFSRIFEFISYTNIYIFTSCDMVIVYHFQFLRRSSDLQWFFSTNRTFGLSVITFSEYIVAKRYQTVTNQRFPLRNAIRRVRFSRRVRQQIRRREEHARHAHTHKTYRYAKLKFQLRGGTISRTMKTNGSRGKEIWIPADHSNMSEKW